MSKLAVVIGSRNWTPEDIAAGLKRPRFKPKSERDPLPTLERMPGWLQGAISARIQFRKEELDRADRLRAYLSARKDSFNEARDVAFAVYVGIRECYALAGVHDAAIADYQRKLGSATRRLE